MTGTAGTIRVLHVDDDASFAEMVATFLEREDDAIEVQTASSASEGRAILDRRAVDCIVSDYDMPGTTGIEFLQTVREDRPDLPFILFTGKGSEQVASEAISAGVTDYLQKAGGTDQYVLLDNRIRNAVERRDAQRERERSERRFEAVFDDPHLLVSVLDPDGRLRNANHTAMEYVDADLEDLVGEYFWGTPWWIPERRADVNRWVQRAAAGEYVEFEADFVRPEGDTRNVTGTIRPVTDDEGTVVSLVVSAQDITERIVHERELEVVHERLDAVISNLPVVLFALDPDGVFTLSKGKGLESLGLEQGEVVGDSVFDVYADHRQLLQDVERALEGQAVESVREVAGRFFDTTYRPLLDEETGEVTAVLGVGIDVTERRTREEELERERNRRSALFENLGEPVSELEFDGDTAIVRDTNEAFERVFGVDAGEVVGESLDAHIVPEDEREAARTLHRRIREGESVEREIRRETTDGVRTFLLRTVPFPVGDEPRAYAIYLDITERTEREHTLEQLRERTAFALEETDSLVWILDLDDDEPMTLHGPAESLFDAPEAEIERPEQFLETVVHPDDRERFREAYDAVRSGDEDRFEIEFRTAPDRGDVRWIEASGYVRGEGSSRTLVGLSTDVTNRKRRAEGRS